LTVTATLDHRPAGIPQVSAQPLLARHSNKCSEQGDRETDDSDDLVWWISLNRRDGGSVTRDGGPVESEENHVEEGGGLLVPIGLEV